MTRKLYWDEPYSRKFTATVDEIDGNRVVLDQTLFYPRGGGVSCDIGTLGGTGVVETIRTEDKIVHSLASSPSFGKGVQVDGELDWERRHRLMRMHTAGHLLSAILYTKVNARITGNQIDVDRSRMDFNLEAFDRSQIEGFVQEANSLIQKDAGVKTYFMERDDALRRPEMVKLAEAFPPAEKQLRIVEIEGIDKQADGGLHVQRLSEIGKIQLLKLENKGKTNRRLYYDLT